MEGVAGESVIEYEICVCVLIQMKGVAGDTVWNVCLLIQTKGVVSDRVWNVCLCINPDKGCGQ